MINQGLMDKYYSLVASDAFRGVSGRLERVRDTIFSIVYLDYTLNKDLKSSVPMDIDKLSAYQDKRLLGLWGIPSSKPDSKATPMPDVQVLRLITDSLILELDTDKLLGTEGVHLTSKVSRLLLKGDTRTGQENADEMECEKVLNIVLDSELNNGDSQFSQVFEFISSQLCKLREIDRASNGVFRKYNRWGDVWLPASYESYGFGVSHKCPARLAAGREHGYFEDSIKCTFITAVLDAFQQGVLLPSGTPNRVLQYTSSMLIQITNDCSDYIPIAMSCNTSNIRAIHIPRYNNNAMNDLVSKIFNPHVGMQMSETTLEQIYGIYSVIYGAREDE